MLLAIDIGNTNITLGVFDDRELLGKFRMTTMMSRTSDEYGITLRELLRNQNMNPDEIDAVIVASVVRILCIHSVVLLLNILDISR